MFLPRQLSHKLVMIYYGEPSCVFFQFFGLQKTFFQSAIFKHYFYNFLTVSVSLFTINRKSQSKICHLNGGQSGLQKNIFIKKKKYGHNFLVYL